MKKKTYPSASPQKVEEKLRTAKWLAAGGDHQAAREMLAQAIQNHPEIAFEAHKILYELNTGEFETTLKHDEAYLHGAEFARKEKDWRQYLWMVRVLGVVLIAVGLLRTVFFALYVWKYQQNGLIRFIPPASRSAIPIEIPWPGVFIEPFLYIAGGVLALWWVRRGEE